MVALLCISTCLAVPPDYSGETAWYDGVIDSEQNRRFFEAIRGKPVRRLVITSTGGEVEAGIELGLWVFEQRVDVEVAGQCLSSCANYVFPAARRKTIHPDAIVAWHGNYNHLQQTGLWRDEIAGRMQRYGEDAATAERRARAEVSRLSALEHDFFARIGVDEYLCWVGKMPPYSLPDYYFLSARDMALFGLTQVHTPPGYEHTDVSKFDRHTRYLRLRGDDLLQGGAASMRGKGLPGHE